MKVRIIGRGTYYTELQRICNSNVTNWNSPELIANWGLCGQRFTDRIEEGSLGTPFTGIPVMNSPVNLTKYSQICKARDAIVPCPESIQLPRGEKPNGKDGKKWLFKPYFSLGGRYICLEEDYTGEVPGYFQEFIPGEERRYELRIHACTWRNPSEFLCQKRVHSDPSQVTWNHHTGGRFITVNEPLKYRVFMEAQGWANAALKAVGLDFGGVDFIVKDDGQILFLEINMALGFTLESSRIFWMDSINKLTEDK